MESQRANAQAALPTRRSLREAHVIDSPLGDSSPQFESPELVARNSVEVSVVPKRQLTRRELRELEARKAQEIAEQTPLIQLEPIQSEPDKVTPEPTLVGPAVQNSSVQLPVSPPTVSLTRAQLREQAREAEVSQAPSPQRIEQTQQDDFAWGASASFSEVSNLFESELRIPTEVAPSRDEATQAQVFESVDYESEVAATPEVFSAQAAAFEGFANTQVGLQADPAVVSTEDILAQVQAVVAQVEQRVQTAHVMDAEHEPIVLSRGFEEAIDTHAPPCELHLTNEIPVIDVIPGTSIPLLNTGLSQIQQGQTAQVYGSAEPAITGSETVHVHAVPMPESLRVGALSRRTNHGETSQPHPAQRQWIPRVAVLSSIGLATIAVPLFADGNNSNDLAGSPEIELLAAGPSTITLVNEVAARADIPVDIALSVTEEERAVLAASRSDARGPLDDCDGSVKPLGSNGGLPIEQLCKVKGYYLQPEAAISFTELNKAFSARFGHEMCLASGYRDLSSQYSVKRQKGSLAAKPGTSNHGWGYAVDLCASAYQSPAKWNWLHANAPTFGWELPDWASRSYEPWHWEYVKGVEETAS